MLRVSIGLFSFGTLTEENGVTFINLTWIREGDLCLCTRNARLNEITDQGHKVINSST